ncbi:NAD(P)H-binding protein [Nocardiopsis alba]|uniref:NAD(P)H-binding protein n=1 Tax=Nocardiopsis alba TaxID=53437 RepID=UPI0033D9E166
MTSRDARTPILVVGAAGTTGRRVTRMLDERGHETRPASRSSEWRFDWNDTDTWDRVLKGARSMYLVQYDPEPLAPAFIERAVEHGVERVVLLSGRGIDDPDYLPEFFGDGEVTLGKGEEAVRASGAEWTILRPGWFAQNLGEGMFGEDVRSGRVALPFGRGRVSWIDAEDIAAVAVAALTEEGHHGRTYELSGPAALDPEETFAEISRAAGRSVEYAPVSVEEFVELRVGRGWSAEDARTFATLLSPIRRGKDEALSDGVRRALGREARSFAEFARDAAASGVWKA